MLSQNRFFNQSVEAQTITLTLLREQSKDINFKEANWIGVLIEPINDLAKDPEVLADEYVIDYDYPAITKVKIVAFPIGTRRTPTVVQREAPKLGQHTEKVFRDILALTGRGSPG